MDRLAQARQGLAPRLGEQAQMEGGELLEVPHIREQAALLGTVLVDEGHRRGGWADPGHGCNLLPKAKACILRAQHDR